MDTCWNRCGLNRVGVAELGSDGAEGGGSNPGWGDIGGGLRQIISHFPELITELEFRIGLLLGDLTVTLRVIMKNTYF